ncbi:MAG TPA: protein phosphatase 2C domain-containing protein [Burkholderiales bacterium]
MKYQIAQLSTPGGRSSNEDRCAIGERKNAVLLALADGLGGHTGGELASQTAIETVMRLFQGVKQPRINDPFAFLAFSMLKAHRAIVSRAQAHTPPLEARTTCVLCLVQEGYAYWAHVGDSRLYHFRAGRLLTRTEDHSTIEELRRDGVITEDEMATHPRKSYLLRCLGSRTEPRISLGSETPLQTGDTLLLCSDGLWEGLPAEDIAKHLAVPRLERGVEEMVYAAEKRMGANCDNVTVACLRWEDRPALQLAARAPIAPQVDAELLWRGAASRHAARRASPPEAAAETAPPPRAKPADRRELIAERIQEIEEYLRRFEPKR